MKYIKLILICVVIASAIFGLKVLFSTSDAKVEISEPELTGIARDYDDRFKAQWVECGHWDNVLYEEQINNIERDHYKLEDDYDLLRDRIQLHALEAIKTKLIGDGGLYLQSVYPQEKVDYELAGLDVIVNAQPSLSDNAVVVELRTANTTYNDMVKFITKVKKTSGETYADNNFIRRSNNDVQWRSFGDVEKKEFAARDNWIKNDYYKRYFKNNNLVKNGLDSVPKYMAAKRGDYYAIIKKTIKAKFAVQQVDINKYRIKYNGIRGRMRYAETDEQLDRINNEEQKLLTDFLSESEKCYARYKSDFENLKSAVNQYTNEYGKDEELNSLRFEFASTEVKNYTEQDFYNLMNQ